MALRVDFYSLQMDGAGDIVDKLVSSYVEVDDHIEVVGTSERIEEPYETIDGVAHDPNEDPDDYLENLYRYYRGSYYWAGHAYEDSSQI